MALVVCITPVAAVSADDFEIVTMRDGEYTNYEYHNVNNPVEEYTRITPGNIKCGWRSFAGVVNLNEHFKGYIKDGLVLELSSGQFISQKFAPWPRWSIPSVD